MSGLSRKRWHLRSGLKVSYARKLKSSRKSLAGWWQNSLGTAVEVYLQFQRKTRKYTALHPAYVNFHRSAVYLTSRPNTNLFEQNSISKQIHGPTQKKMRLTLELGNQEWEGRDKQTAIEHVLTCHSVTRLSSIALLNTSGRIFKYRRVLFLGRKMSDCKCDRVNIKFLVKMMKFATETFQLLTEAYGEDCMSCARVSELH